MSIRRAADALAMFLIVLLWLGALATIGIAALLIWRMEPSSASQGGRYYIATAALVVLVLLDRQMTLLVRRRLPFSLGTLPAERRHHLRTYLLLVAAGVFLFGLAHYRTTGSSSGLATIGLFGAGLAAIPVLLVLIVARFVRPLDRGASVAFDRAKEPSAPRTWSFSFGTPPAAPDIRQSRRRAVAGVPADRAAWYNEAWLRIRGKFADDPAAAVRQAHSLILDLVAETGHSGQLTDMHQFEANDPSELPVMFESSLQRLGKARDIQAATRSVLAGGSASNDALQSAMDEYERILKRLLAGTR